MLFGDKHKATFQLFHIIQLLVNLLMVIQLQEVILDIIHKYN